MDLHCVVCLCASLVSRYVEFLDKEIKTYATTCTVQTIQTCALILKMVVHVFT